MLDHPEEYTKEQIEALLVDEEISSFAHNLAMTKRAMNRHDEENIRSEERRVGKEGRYRG